MVYITHDQAEAMALADRIAVMEKGRLLQLATPSKLYREPATPIVASFIGAGMVMPCEVLAAEADGRAHVSLYGHRFEARCRAGQPAVAQQPLCLRSADLSLVETGGLEGTVRRMIYQGGFFRVEVRLAAAPEVTLALDVPEPTALNPGSTVRIGIGDGWVVPEADRPA
jgi:iron(III) transport system ATP-binding protein